MNNYGTKVINVEIKPKLNVLKKHMFCQHLVD